MSAAYEFWLTDDAGRKMFLLEDFAFASYSRSTRGYGTILFGMPLDSYLPQAPIIFQPDWRIDVYRSPDYGVLKRRESSYLLRKFRIYDRVDGVRMIEFFGRSPIDLLRRQSIQYVADGATLTGKIDDLMKDLVTGAYVPIANLYTPGEFSVESKVALGPTETITPYGKVLLDVITDLKNTSFGRNSVSTANRKIYFDVVEGPGLTNGFGYMFRTYADRRGMDRTKGVVFSAENGNLRQPEYYEDYLDEITACVVNSSVSVQNSDRYLSRWNMITRWKSSVSTDASANAAEAAQILSENGKKISLGAYFLSTPGSPNQPQSLYGVDWDLGDLLPVQYAGKNIQTDVEIVWVSVNEDGEENIVGSNRVGVV